jgi:hypothetical protein
MKPSAYGLWTQLLAELEQMPEELARAVRGLPEAQLRWLPEARGGSPGETFSAIEHVCHLRDIEKEGYHVRIRRLLEEAEPSLESLNGDELARARAYAEADLNEALAGFAVARAQTVARLRAVTTEQLARTGEFAEYGRLSLRGLVHYLRSHDQQHLAGLHWLAGKAASRA